jgi:hypothetical protein
VIVMRTRSVMVEAPTEERRESQGHAPTLDEGLALLALRVHGEYREMPGLRLTVRQAARLFSIEPAVAQSVLDELRQASVLTCSDQGAYSLNR